jgi:two-component system alkaline phosphatase synthesis response regulator PhoP
MVKDEEIQFAKGAYEFPLSLKEFEVLKLLLENRGKTITRNQLLDEIWGYEYYGETRTVDVHIRHLRSKLDSDKEDSIIHTIRGIGYLIK